MIGKKNLDDKKTNPKDKDKKLKEKDFAEKKEKRESRLLRLLPGKKEKVKFVSPTKQKKSFDADHPSQSPPIGINMQVHDSLRNGEDPYFSPSGSQKDDIDVQKMMENIDVQNIDQLFTDEGDIIAELGSSLSLIRNDSNNMLLQSLTSVAQNPPLPKKNKSIKKAKPKEKEKAKEKAKDRRKSTLLSFQDALNSPDLLPSTRVLGMMGPIDLWSKHTRRELCSGLPRHKVPPLNSGLLANIRFLDEEEIVYYNGELAACQATSTYPRLSLTTTARAGDPICDYYGLDIFDRAAVVAISDGCSWGVGSREAARSAATAFAGYVSPRLTRLRHVKKAASAVLRGFAAAQQAVVTTTVSSPNSHSGSSTSKKVGHGTTTLLGGVLLPIYYKTSDTEQLRWAFVFGSVGDCKAFVWSIRDQTVTDLTHANRANACDPSDCGGRLGAYLDGGPDLRNLRVESHICDEGDIVFVVSDGVHDNFDPQHLGRLPEELGLEAGQWKDLTDFEAVNRAKTTYREIALARLINHPRENENGVPHISEPSAEKEVLSGVSPLSIARDIVNYCRDVTKESRRFIEENPKERLPEDFVKYPGKMDHVSVVGLRVSRIYNISKSGRKTFYGTW